VSDLAASLAFYRDGLGVEVISRSVTSADAARVGQLPEARAQVIYLRVPGSDATLDLLEFACVEQHAGTALRTFSEGVLDSASTKRTNRGTAKPGILPRQKSQSSWKTPTTRRRIHPVRGQTVG
jgi:catechol 2,3-dioxygenase-like lactoylglutathione lyase family enzyme